MNIVRTTHRIEPRFVLDPFEPAYLSLLAEEIGSRVEAGLSELEDCCACPRNCHVNRMANETNVCNTGRYARVASVSPHFGEEDCLRGWGGSGTIFFSLCNLRCVFCQNWDISQRSVGKELPPERIADVMPGQSEETAAIFHWLSEEVSPDTYVNIMGQYGPAYEVGASACNGDKKYDEIKRRLGQHEMLDAYAAARDARLWRFDERWLR